MIYYNIYSRASMHGSPAVQVRATHSQVPQLALQARREVGRGLKGAGR